MSPCEALNVFISLVESVEKMTIVKISTYYKWLSLLTLIVSIVWSITLVEGTVTEKFGNGLLVNLQFHLAFQFLSRVPLGIYQRIERENSKIKTLSLKILKIFSLFIIILSVIGLVSLLSSAMTDRKYEELIVTMTFIAMFLGGYSSNLKLVENSSTLHQQENEFR